MNRVPQFHKEAGIRTQRITCFPKSVARNYISMTYRSVLPALTQYDVSVPLLHGIVASAAYQVNLTCIDPTLHSGKLVVPSLNLAESTRKQRFGSSCGKI